MRPDFSPRACPFCGASRHETLFAVTPRQFAAPNPTYRADYCAILGVAQDDPFPIARCMDCGFVFAALLPPPDFLDALYERVIDADAALAASRDKADLARRLAYLRVLTAAKKDAGARALDFGAGYGPTARLLAASGFATVAHDGSASRRAILAGAEGVSVVTDAAALVACGPFDVLVADNVLEHVAEPDAAAALLAAASDTGAMLFVSVPSYEPHEIAAAARLAGRGECDLSLNPWEHLNYFSLAALDRLLARRGFRPLAAAALAGPVDIGLRPETRKLARWKNGLASVRRLARYAVCGRGVESAVARYYVFDRG